MTMQLWVAIAVIVGQGALVGAVLWLVRSFGAYTSIVLQTHQQNMLIQQENFNLSDDLARLRSQMLEEKARRRQQPPDHAEEVVA
jgi:hypothetical protein